MSIILTFFYTLVFGLFIWNSAFFQIKGIGKKTMLGVFLLKITVGFLLYFIYTQHHQDRATADIFKYFDDSYHMTKALWTKPVDYFKMLFGVWNNSAYFNETYYGAMNNWFRVYQSSMYNDSHAIIRFNAFVRIFSFGHYHVHTVFMCFVSFTGLVAFTKALAPLAPHKSKLVFYILTLTPSALLWSSGVLKEGILFFCLGFILYGSNQVIHKKLTSWKGMVWLLATAYLLLLLFQLKFYVFAVFSLGFLGYTLYFLPKFKNLFVNYFIAIIIGIIIGANLHFIAPEFKVLNLIVTKQADFIALAKAENANSYFEITPLKPSLISLANNSPEALFNSFFRPFVWDAKGVLVFFSAIENIIVFVLLISNLFFMKAPSVSQRNLLVFFLITGLGIYLVVGWTTPVAGALVRYKVPGTLFLLLTALILLDKDKLRNKIPPSVTRYKKYFKLFNLLRN